MTMQVCFTPTIFDSQRVGGISRYFVELAAELPPLGVEVKIPGLVHQSEYLREAPRGLTSALWLPLRELRMATVASIANRCFLPLQASFRHADCVHETYFFPPQVTAKQSLVITVYDMIHERFPALMTKGDPTARQKAAAVRRADHVICISQRTADDLIAFIPEASVKATVVHLGGGCDREIGPAEITTTPERPYLLYVGDRSHYKNFRCLIQALANTPLLRETFQLVAFGSRGFSVEERHAIAAAGLSESAVVHVAGDDHLLSQLYRAAAALVYPSLYEGFGMPVVEAMSHGCPVVCSTGGALPEVAGSAAEYFDPHSSEDLARAIGAVVMAPSRRRQLVENGRIVRQRFSWSRCAAQTAAVYRAVT